MSIAYFVHELADPAVRRRADTLRMGGQQVALFGFDRVRDGQSQPSPPGAHVLGRTRNQAFAQRVLAVAAAVPKALGLREAWRTADAILARNLEMLFLAVATTQLSGARTRIVYECLDLHRLILDRGPAGALLRAIERSCLRRAALVVTSSPAFDRHFRTTQRYDGPMLLVENKVLGATPAPPGKRQSGPPWTIAWCGVLRCARSFSALRALAQARPEGVRVVLRGAPALDALPSFHDALAQTPNMTFGEAYAAADLPGIYGDAHFAWAIDYYEAGGNSDLLLPNRLYESLAFGAAPIAVEGVATAQWLERHGVGVVLRDPIETSLMAFVDGLTADGYAATEGAIAKLDPELTWMTPQACRALTAQIAGVAP